jgi:hypothetical protein
MRVYNPTASPIVVSADGRSVAGGEWGDADPDFAGTTSAVERGALLAADGPQEAKQPVAADTGGPPPRAGTGSGVEAWRAYADGKVELTDDMKRDDIIAALEDAGFAVGEKE